MSSVSIEQRIRAQATVFPALVALLKDPLVPNAPFRWDTDSLLQGTRYPAVAVKVVSNPPMYSHDGRLPTSWARVQFTIWGGQFTAGAQAREDVGAALNAFFATLRLSTRPADLPQPNFVALDRNDTFREKDQPTYQRIIDLMVFVDDSI